MLRDWGVIPAVLPMTICQQTIRNRMTESHDSGLNDGPAFLSYHQFNRVLMFLSTEIVKFPDSPALLNENRLISDIDSPDEAIDFAYMLSEKDWSAIAEKWEGHSDKWKVGFRPSLLH